MVVAMMVGSAIGLTSGVLLGNYAFSATPPKDFSHLDIKADVDDEIETAEIGEPVGSDIRDVLPCMPEWVSVPDYERVFWINKTLQILWPFYNRSICKDVLTQVKPLIDDAIKGIPMVEEANIEVLDLGDAAPKLGGLKAFQSNEDEAILEAPLIFGSSIKVRVSARIRIGPVSVYVPVEVKNMSLHAVARITFRPLVEVLPCLGAVTVSLLETPTVDLGLSLINDMDIMCIPGIKEVVSMIVKQQCDALITYPNSMSFDIMENGGVAPKPQGMLIVQIASAKLESSGELSLSKPDPVVSVEVREGRVIRSERHSNTREPEFNEEFKLVVDDPLTQTLKIKVENAETLSFSGATVMGEVEISLDPKDCKAVAVKGPRVDMVVDLYKPKGAGGKLTGKIKSLGSKIGRSKSSKARLGADVKSVGKLRMELQYVPFFMDEDDLDLDEDAGPKPPPSHIKKLARPFVTKIRGDQKGVLTVNLTRCANLKGGDDDVDSHVEMVLYDPEDARNRDKPLMHRSTVKENEASPRWGEKFDFVNISATSSVTFYVKNGRSDLGRIRIPVANAARNGRIKDMWPLQDCKSGEIYLTMEWSSVQVDIGG